MSRRNACATRPIIALTSDFGLTDSYVAVIKAVLTKCGSIIESFHRHPIPSP